MPMRCLSCGAEVDATNPFGCSCYETPRPDYLREVYSDAQQYWEDALDERLAALRALMIARHRKYGPTNITSGGVHGLIIRMQDKLARLRQRHAVCSLFGPCLAVEEFADEVVLDTCQDLANYAGIIYPMLLDGTWELPMREP